MYKSCCTTDVESIGDKDEFLFKNELIQYLSSAVSFWKSETLVGFPASTHL